MQYNVITEMEDATVVAEYKSVKSKSNSYESEASLETSFIKLLTEEGYEYLNIHHAKELIDNLRIKLQELNDYVFTDEEWQRFLVEHIINSNEGIKEKTRTIQEDSVKVFKKDNGESKNIILIDKTNIHNNKLQVINQYEANDGKYKNRYDVTILVNGFPLIHVELKRRSVAIKEAFNQIERYQKESFWSESGLYEYVQIFVISNGTHTKYYSNTTRFDYTKDKETKNEAKKKKTSNSFEFTSYWADANNNIIPDLIDFTKTFFSKNTILNILTKYCVFTDEEKLLVMRPYQIVATERIINKINVSHNYKKCGSIEAGGYIWHTTGSGKTLTSFKTAILASKLPFIDKVLFVVDRKDLDYQTMREYDRFEKGAANSNTSTAILAKQLEPNSKSKIIITTIQKLSMYLKNNANIDTLNKEIVIIFDECHRSQFGDMHILITKSFKKYYLFGFTGTPIFAVNAGATKHNDLKTTEQAFGQKLHTYTIVNAINDNNVLPFKVDYIKTIDKENEIRDKKVSSIDIDKVYMAPKRITNVTKYILDKFDDKTYRNNKYYSYNKLMNIADVVQGKIIVKEKQDDKGRIVQTTILVDKDGKEIKEIKTPQKLSGFNSIFCVSSIDAAKAYYEEFIKQMKEDSAKKIRIATIYSYGANEEENDGIIEDENSEDTSNLSEQSRDFLEYAIKNYNETFHTNYDTSSDKFQNYYKDVSMRMKNKEIDLLIVVNMFLTGFDATTLNTLWVDKNLRQHGLIQSFSRTNRILNSVKTFGNIVCFRNLHKEVDDAISLFGDKNACGIILLKGFRDYYEGYIDDKGDKKPGYIELIDELFEKYPLNANDIIGEQKKKDFIKLFGAILRARNILNSFDEFESKEIITDREMQDYQSIYNDLYLEVKQKNNNEKENIIDDVVFETELIKQIEINIDYILLLVEKYHNGNAKDKEIRISINKAIDSSLELRSKKELINSFIDNINNITNVYDEWKEYVKEEKEKSLKAIIVEENLKEELAKDFMEESLKEGYLKITGMDIDNFLPPVSRFSSASSNRTEVKNRVIEKLKKYFDKFFGVL